MTVLDPAAEADALRRELVTAQCELAHARRTISSLTSDVVISWSLYASAAAAVAASPTSKPTALKGPAAIADAARQPEQHSETTPEAGLWLEGAPEILSFYPYSLTIDRERSPSHADPTPEIRAIPSQINAASAQPDLVRRRLQELDEFLVSCRADFVLVSALPGALEGGWAAAIRSALHNAPTAVAVLGSVVDATGHAVGAMPSIYPAEASSRSCRAGSSISGGVWAIVPSIYREVGRFSLDADSVEEALISFSLRARTIGYKVVHAPGLTLRLPESLSLPALELIELERDLIGVAEQRLGIRRTPRVLVIDARTPTPDQDAGSMDTVWGMRILSALGYELTFIPYYEREHAGRYTRELEVFGVICPVAPELSTVEQFLEEYGTNYDLILIYRVVVGFKVIQLCRSVAPRAKIVFHTVDLHFLREERLAVQSGRDEDLKQAIATRSAELDCIRNSDCTVLVSTFEYELIKELLPDARTHVIPIMHPAPGRLSGRPGREGAVFVGGFKHSPNVDAVEFLCREIWPLVRTVRSDLVLRIIGSNPPEKLMKLSSSTDGVEFLGFVDNLLPIYNRSMVNLAPLRFGAGIKGKVLSAMLFGVPTVATSVAVEGMGLSDGYDVLVGDDAQIFANQILKIFDSADLWEAISDRGFQTAQAEFSVDAQIPRIRAMLRELDLPC